MAAGDLRLQVNELHLKRNAYCIVEYKYGIEPKAGEVDYRGNTLQLSWDEFQDLLSAGEKNALVSILGKLKQQIVNTDVTRWGVALDG